MESVYTFQDVIHAENIYRVYADVIDTLSFNAPIRLVFENERVGDEIGLWLICAIKRNAETHGVPCVLEGLSSTTKDRLNDFYINFFQYFEGKGIEHATDDTHYRRGEGIHNVSRRNREYAL